MKHFCKQTIGILSDKSFDQYGRERWNDAVYYKGRFIEKVGRVIKANGEETTSDGVVYFYTDVPVEIDYAVKIDNNIYRVIGIDKPRDGYGNVSHYKVYVKREST